MRIKTTVSISQELLAVMEEFLDNDRNRSRFLEEAAWHYIARLRRTQGSASDIESIERRADYFNAEVSDALAYQVIEQEDAG